MLVNTGMGFAESCKADLFPLWMIQPLADSCLFVSDKVNNIIPIIAGDGK